MMCWSVDVRICSQAECRRGLVVVVWMVFDGKLGRLRGGYLYMFGTVGEVRDSGSVFVVVRFSPVGIEECRNGREKSGGGEPIKRGDGEETAGARTFLCLKGGG